MITITRCTQVTIIFIAGIDRSNYALELISKMLNYKHDDRISSGEVVIQLKSIKQKVPIIVNEINSPIIYSYDGSLLK